MATIPLALYLVLVLQFWIALASRTDLTARWNTTGFVTASGGRFMLNGSLWRFYGTNAYWLQMVSNDDIDFTMHNIATAGFRVVRVWAFNDVSSKPSSGTYFQILQGGKATINTGADGLQKLDQVVAAAQKYGVKLLLTLTNNWNPERPTENTAFDRRNNVADNGQFSERGFLSNDYGGIDLYVRNFHPGGTHDLFYTDSTIISAFKNYVAQVVKRYASNPTVLGWELGNDIRCSSTTAASSSCNPQTITKWVFQLSNYIKSLDSNHLVTAGDGGFYCLGCPKLYAKQFRQPSSLLSGPSFTGAYGVDTEDILASPCIDFGSFQLFPDQVDYFPEQLPSFATKAIRDGGEWVALHTSTSDLEGKPEVLTAMELVTKDFWSSFVPFNMTAPFPDTIPCRGVEEFQLTYAFTSWAATALNGIGVDGVLEYLWVQSGLTGHGTTIVTKRDAGITSSSGGGNYMGLASGQSAQQMMNSGPGIPGNGP